MKSNEGNENLRSGQYSDGLGDLDAFLREGLDYNPLDASDQKPEDSPSPDSRDREHSRKNRKKKKSAKEAPEEQPEIYEDRKAQPSEASEASSLAEIPTAPAVPAAPEADDIGAASPAETATPEFDYGDYFEEEGDLAAPGGKKRKHTGWWIALGVAAALVIAAGIFGYAEKNSDKIFPNVFAEGINLGGMTQADAEKFLQQTQESKVSNDELAKVRVLTVEFSNGGLVRVDLAKAGVNPGGEGQNAAELAKEAYAYGREGNIFTACFQYIQSATKSYSVDGSAENAADDKRLNKDYIMERINIGLGRMKATGAGEYTVNEAAKTLTIVKNPTRYDIDAENVYIVIAQSIQDRTYGAFIPYEINEKECIYEINWNQIHDKVYRAMVNASYRADTGSVTESVTGVDFDVEDATKRWDAAKNGQKVTIPLTITEPEVTTEQAEAQRQRLINQYSDTDDGSNSNWNNYDDSSGGEEENPTTTTSPSDVTPSPTPSGTASPGSL